MSRILILCPDHIKRSMSGPAIRYFELAHQLVRAGHEVSVGTRGSPDLGPQPFELFVVNEQRIRHLLPRQDVLLFQGYMLNSYPFLQDSGACLVPDLYCPFYLELLVDRMNSRPGELGSPMSQLRITLDQLRVGDFFICASEKQRDYWLGMLTAVNRINPDTHDDDPSLRSLIDVVPFGLPDDPPRKEKPAMRGVIPGIGNDDYVVLWGSSIYNWFDPLTLIRATGSVSSRIPEIRLVVMATRHTNPELVAETEMLRQARRLSDELGLTGKHVFFNEGWVPYNERADWLLEADVGVSTHLAHIESHFSFRVRFLDYLWAGLPFLVTSGDVIAEAVESDRLGLTVAPANVSGLANALERLADRSVRETYRRNVRTYGSRMSWSRVTEPLVRFCGQPRRAADLARVGAGRIMPVPIDDANGTQERDWRHYAIKAASALVYEGPSGLAKRSSRFVARRLARNGRT